MATAPFQLWLDLAQISSAVRTSGTVTVTTASPHGISTGAYIQMENATGVAGTSMNGVYQVTATSGSTFTYTSSGTAGTGVTGSAAISYDLLNPLNNYSGTAKESALYIPTDSLLFGVSGDGSGASSSMTVFQDDVPSDGPWFNLIPDQSRVRLIKASTGGTPAADGSDLYFTSLISNVSAQMNGSGQGVVANVAMQDATSLLDKVFIYPPDKQPRFIQINGVVRTDNRAYVTTNVGHGFGTVGGTASVAVSQVTGGGTVTFNGGPLSVSIESANTFSYANVGPAGTGNINIVPTAISASGSSFYITMPDVYHGLASGGGVIINGVTGGDAAGRNLLNRVWEDSSFPGTTAGTLVLTAGTSLVNTSYNVDTATVRGYAVATPIGTLGERDLVFGAGTTEDAIVTNILANVNVIKAPDAAFQRFFNTAGTAKINGSTTITNREALTFTPQGIRGALDEVVSVFQGIDGKPRRYFVDPNGNLNYSISSDDDAPTYATAPYKLITSGTQNPNTTTAAATLIPYGLEIGLDYHMTKAGIPTGNDATSLTVTTYRDYEYPERKNAPLLDGTIEEAQVAVDYEDNSYRYARSFFSQAYAPLLSGRATLRGAGTADFNQYGFSAGYAQTGASTFALVKRWEPGQWVEITAAELGLSGLYRIEQVDWTLERGSFTQIVVITFSYKPPFTLTNQLSQVR